MVSEESSNSSSEQEEVTAVSEATPTPQDSSEKETLLGTSETKEDDVTEEQKDGVETEQSDVPENYDLVLKKESLLTEDHFESVTKFAKDNKFTNEQAQSLLDRDHEIRAQHQEQIMVEHYKKVEGWEQEVRDHKELGGENLKSTLEFAKCATERFGTSEFREALNVSGLGNHPGLVEFAAKVGKAMSDDSFSPSGSPTKKELTLPERLYPGFKKNT